jgi:uncharacterized protein
MYIRRHITSILKDRLQKFPILTLTGPRQSGKTTLLINEFKDYKYFNLERIDFREMIMNDPLSFLKSNGPGVIFDEVQRVPDLFSYLQVISDERSTPGQYILSGSQSFLMNDSISQSLAGRTHVSHLLPFDVLELPVKKQKISKTILHGFYPRLHNMGIKPHEFFPSYIQTYIERDIRTLKAIEDLNAFTRFLRLCAGRVGQILNLSSLSNDAGISVNTVKSWISLLQSSFVIFLLQPFHKNFNKRIIKSPKIYFYDTGLVCSLLQLKHPEMIESHYLYGSLYENYVISEIIKTHYHAGILPSVYYWRESNGIEIDCIIEKNDQKTVAVEIKGGYTFNNDYLKNFRKVPFTETVKKILVYPGENSTVISGINLMGQDDFNNFLKELLL